MKRGQITMFIIVGIVILFIIGLSIVAWRIVNAEKPPEDRNKKDIPTELKPLQNVVEQCLDSASRSVLTKIGEHGGYYDPLADGYVSIPGQPTLGRAFDPFPGMTVPKWSYLASANTCTNCYVASEEPPLSGQAYPAIEFQAEKAISSEVLGCLNNFAGLENQYVITTTGSPTTSVEFGEGNTVVTLNYPLQVKTESQSTASLSDFSVDLDIPFKSLYDEADKIRQSQDNSRYFESLSLEAVTLTSFDNSIPPPSGDSGLTYDSGPIWTLQDTTTRVAQALEKAVNIVQVLGSRDMDFIQTGNDVTDAQYANYLFSIDSPDPNVSAHFLYFSKWQPYVRVSPGGQVIRPQTFSSGLPFLPPLKLESFKYDISYPILVQLAAPTQKGDFTFQFGIEANMRANQPLNFEPVITSTDTQSYCDPSLWSGDTSTITVTDNKGMPLDAQLSYQCTYDECQLGQAQNGKLVTKLPVCLGGKLVAQRDGYSTVSVNQDSTGQQSTASISLEKLVPITVTPDLHFLQKTDSLDGTTVTHSWSLETNSYDLLSNEHAIIVFTPVTDDTLTQVAVFPSTTGPVSVKLFPGEYTVSVVFLEDLLQPYTIPGKQVCYDTEPLNPLGGTKCQTIPPVTLGAQTVTDPDTGATQDIGGTLYLGGLDWSNDTHTVNITQDMLDRGSITIPIVGVDLKQITDIDYLDAFDAIAIESNKLNLN